MKADKQELIRAQLSRAEEAYTMATLAIEAKFWNSAASELYYTCFYLIRALFSLHDIQAQTHSGVKSLFALKFIKEQHIEKDGKIVF
jgi:uncharacterized protein (UPF0332 family)